MSQAIEDSRKGNFNVECTFIVYQADNIKDVKEGNKMVPDFTQPIELKMEKDKLENLPTKALEEFLEAQRTGKPWKYEEYKECIKKIMKDREERNNRTNR